MGLPDINPTPMAAVSPIAAALSGKSSSIINMRIQRSFTFLTKPQWTHFLIVPRGSWLLSIGAAPLKKGLAQRGHFHLISRKESLREIIPSTKEQVSKR